MPFDTPAARRAIHAECRKQGIDTETRHTLIREVGRVASGSTSDLDADAARRVLNHLRRQGGAPNEWAWVDTAAPDKRPLLRKIIVMCRELGLTRGSQQRYCEGIARRQHGSDRHLPMMDAGELWRIVCALERTLRYRTPGAPLPDGGITVAGKPA